MKACLSRGYMLAEIVMPMNKTIICRLRAIIAGSHKNLHGGAQCLMFYYGWVRILEGDENSFTGGSGCSFPQGVP